MDGAPLESILGVSAVPESLIKKQYVGISDILPKTAMKIEHCGWNSGIECSGSA